MLAIESNPHEQQQAHLCNQLMEFGLNPRDWLVIPVGRGRYKVQYANDKSWYFMGSTKEQERGIQWDKLQLASL